MKFIQNESQSEKKINYEVIQNIEVIKQEEISQEEERVDQPIENSQLSFNNEIMVSFDTMKNNNFIESNEQKENNLSHQSIPLKGILNNSRQFEINNEFDENNESEENIISIDKEVEKYSSRGFSIQKENISQDINPFIIQKKNIVPRKSTSGSEKNSIKSENQITAKLPSMKSNIESNQSSKNELEIAEQKSIIQANSNTNEGSINSEIVKSGHETIGVSTDLSLLDPLIESILSAIGYNNKQSPSKITFNEDLVITIPRHLKNQSESKSTILASNSYSHSKTIIPTSFPSNPPILSYTPSNIMTLSQNPSHIFPHPSSSTPPFMPIYSTEDPQNTQMTEDALNTSTDLNPSISTSPFLLLVI